MKTHGENGGQDYIIPQLLRPKEVAQKLAISLRAFWRLVADNNLRTVKIGRSTRVSVTDLVAYIERSRNGRVA